MTPLPHHYDVHLTGGRTGYALLSTAGVPELRTSPPVDNDSPGDAWSPEHLLLASVQACFLFTLRTIAPLSKVDFLAIELDASGTVNRQDGVTRFSQIVLRPRLTVPRGTNANGPSTLCNHRDARRLLTRSRPHANHSWLP